MPEEKPKDPVNEVILRSYPKVIFFYPLLFTTLILWIIQAVSEVPGDASTYVSALGAIWFRDPRPPQGPALQKASLESPGTGIRRTVGTSEAPGRGDR